MLGQLHLRGKCGLLFYDCLLGRNGRLSFFKIDFNFILLSAVVVKESHFESGYGSWTSLGDKEKKWKLSNAKTFKKYPSKLLFSSLDRCDYLLVSMMDPGKTSLCLSLAGEVEGIVVA